MFSSPRLNLTPWGIWLVIPVTNNSGANEEVCGHVSAEDKKTHQCNLISDPIVLVRFFTDSEGENSPPMPHFST